MRITESRIRQIIREETSKILEQIDRHYPDVGDIVTRIIEYEEYNSDVSYTGPDPKNPPGMHSNELSSNFARGRHADEMDETLEAMQETGFITFNPKSGMYFLTPKAMEMFVDGEWTGPNTNMLYDEMERSKNAQAPAAAPKSMSASFKPSNVRGNDPFGGAPFEEDEDEGGEFEDEEMTVQGVIERYKDEGARSWMRVSNDFYEMADGGMSDIRKKYYPGLTAKDCAFIAAELDRYFGM